MLHHAADCKCERYRHRRRKSLRYCGYGDSYSRHEHLKYVLTPNDSGCEYKHADRKAYHGNYLSKFGKTLLERCHIPVDIGEHLGYLSHLSVLSGSYDFCRAYSPDSRCSAVDYVLFVDRIISVRGIACGLRNSFGFAGKYGFVCKKSVCLEDTAVSRYSVAGFKFYHISRNKFGCRPFTQYAVTPYFRCRCCHRTECFKRVLRAVFLYEAKYSIQQNYQDYRDRIGYLTEKYRDRRRRKKYHHHDISELPGKYHDRSRPLLLCKYVAALFAKLLRRLFFSQSHIITLSDFALYESYAPPSPCMRQKIKL